MSAARDVGGTKKRKAAPKVNITARQAKNALAQRAAFTSQGKDVEARAYVAAPRPERDKQVSAARHAPARTPGQSAVLGIHGVRTSAHTREHNRLVAPGKYYAGSTPTVTKINRAGAGDDPFKGLGDYTKRALKHELTTAERASAQKITSTPVKPAWLKGARAGTLFAVQQLLRPSAALGAAQLNRSAKGGSSIGSRFRAAKKGFAHPDQHAGDWVKAAEKQHWPLPVVTGTAASIVADPTTYVAPGFGSGAKAAALKAYSEALASGAERHVAVAAARKVWEEAPAHTKVPGVHLRASGGVPFSRKLRFSGKTGTLSAPGLVKSGLAKVGAKPVVPGGAAARKAVRAVMPSVRPAGMDPVTHHLIRQAGVEGRAGERAANRHAEARLHAYDKALKGIPEERQLAIRKALQDTPHVADEAQRRSVFAAHGLTDQEQVVAHEMANERRVQYAAEPDRVPLTAESRVGHVAPPVPTPLAAAPKVDVAATRARMRSLQNRLETAIKDTRAPRGIEAGLKRLRIRQATKTPSVAEQAAHGAVADLRAQVKDAALAHREARKLALAQRRAVREHQAALASYEAAPKGYVHTPLKPEVLTPEHAARQSTGRGAKAGSYSYQRQGKALEDLTPEQLSDRELRIPVTQAHRALEHKRILNAQNVNNWIASLGHATTHEAAAGAVGSKARLFAQDERGFTPLFDKYGKVDAALVNRATRAGHPIVDVPTGVDESVRQLARGNKVPRTGDALSLVGEGDAKNAAGVFDRGTRSLKFAQTQVNPSYHIRNLVGDTFNALIAGTTGADFVRSGRNIRTHMALRKLERVMQTTEDGVRAQKALAKANGRIRRYSGVPGGMASDAQVMALAAKHGAIDTGFNAGELMAVREGTDVKNLSKYQRAKSKIATASDARENFVRLATFQGALDRGMTPEAAGRWSLDHHFDYSDLSAGEQNFARRVFPFWTFMARNTPLQVKSLATRPMIAGNVEKLRRGTFTASGIPQNAASGMEPFEQTNTPWGTGLRAPTGPLTAAPALPTMDLSNIPLGFNREQLSQAGGNVLGRMHPLLGTGVIGVGLGKNPLNLRDVPAWVPAPSWWPADGVPGLPGSKPVMTKDARSGEPVRSISGKLAMVLNIVPPISVASKIGTPSAASQGPSPALLRGAGWALGPRVAVENPHTRKITQYYDRVDQIDATLRRIEPQALTHKTNSDWKKGSPVRKLLDEKQDMLAKIYAESKARGDKNPLGMKRGKGRTPAAKKIGSFSGTPSLGQPGGPRIGGFGG